MLTIAGAFAGGRFDPRAMLARGAGWLSARDRARSRAAEPTPSPRRATFPGRPFPWEASYPPGIAWDVDLPERPLSALLDDAVARFSRRPCVECLGRRYSYREVGRLADRAGAGLQALGVGPGVRVGLVLPNTPYYVILYYAVLKAGGTVVNHNPLYAAEEIRHQIVDADVRMLATVDLQEVHGKLAGLLDELPGVRTVVVCPMAGILRFPCRQLFGVAGGAGVLSTLPRDGRHIAFARLLEVGARPAPVRVDPRRDVAVLQYTGGVDGVSKAAALTHVNLVAAAALPRAWLPGLTDGCEVILGALPLSHVFGMAAVLNSGLLSGACLVLLPHPTVNDILRAAQRRRVTFLPATPAIFGMIAGRGRAVCRRSLSSLRLCMSGGAPLPAEVQHRFEEATGCLLIDAYGLTEASAAVTCNPASAEGRRTGSVGLPFPRTVVEIVSPGGGPGAAPLPAGTAGEVCVRGPQVMAGYWRRPDATARVLDGDGRLRTGDLGYLDEMGFLHVTGRLKPLILVGGYNVYPVQVEAAIRAHPAVADATVRGTLDSRLGERVEATVRLRPGARLTAEELRAHLGDRLAPFEMPRRVRFVGEPAEDATPPASIASAAVGSAGPKRRPARASRLLVALAPFRRRLL
ncbi:MAG: long-chain-fatty-acid--CoA ligase [Geminicoccaceae bacterium]|nr:long-chain-fatty-acid--CoA ligase [Geminicoccaceae bacterium]